MPQKRQSSRVLGRRRNRLIGKRRPRQLELNLGLQGRRPFEAWFSEKDIRKMIIYNARLGKGEEGIVFRGKIIFKDGSIKPIAIKRFYADRLSPNSGDEEAAKYSKAIKDVARAGIPIPKMGMVKLRKGTRIGHETLEQDEWVLVSQQFKTKGKTARSMIINEASERKDVIWLADIYARLINAGYVMPMDMLEVIQVGNSFEVMTLDIGSLVLTSHFNDRKPLLERAYEDLKLIKESTKRSMWEKIFIREVLERIKNRRFARDLEYKLKNAGKENNY